MTILRKIVLLFFGVLVALLCLEIALRIAGFSFPSFVRRDPDLGWSLRPNQEGWTRNEGGRIYLKISSSGLRDIEHSKDKPPDTFRVAILGDSYAEAAQVQMDQTFWAIMGRRLAACPSISPKKIEAINFGVDGYSTGQELLTLRDKVWDYSPDMVVLLFTPSNDVTDNSPILAVEKDKPFFIYREGKLETDTSFRHTAGYRIRDSLLVQLYYRSLNVSRTLQLVRQAMTLWRQRSLGRAVQGTTESGGTVLGLADLSYRAPGAGAWHDAWDITEGLLREASEEAKARRMAFLVVTATRAIQVDPDREVRRRSMRLVGIDDLFYPEKRIAALGASSGFSTLILAQPFQAYAERNHEVLHFQAGHWDVSGNRLAGEMIADRICEIQAQGQTSGTQSLVKIR